MLSLRCKPLGLVPLASALVLSLACGGSQPPPKRGVIESNVSGWNFRRYQKVMDVEIWVAKNRAVAYTASYVRDSAEKEGILDDGDVVSAFITRYKRSRGIMRALVKFVRRLAQDFGYEVEERSKSGVRFISITGNGEAWALWASRKHVVKIGGRGVESVPEDLVEAYGERYPSRISEGILDAPLPPGPDFNEKDEEDEEYDPDNPTPDWQEFETEGNKASKRKKSKNKDKE